MRRKPRKTEDIIDAKLLSFLRVWRKKREVLRFLYAERGMDIAERTWRNAIDEFNETALQLHGIYIAHGPKGYIATDDYNYLRFSQRDYFKRAIYMLRKSRKLGKLMGQMDIIPLELNKYIDQMEEKETICQR